ncbi:hypothetical protein CKAN_02032700 [Cinnamomum micranthum f. kanehirae]|uniref:Uncharacterized protein n=1 Tax=Cinnamomum micranthum f. kanehirae TaxID=337451 RepID=A0A3S3NFD6_9MAGN|nr:hypothetical protein CKAN_02032700 [Cinnamomum micranthum f. kanehirae]
MNALELDNEFMDAVSHSKPCKCPREEKSPIPSSLSADRSSLSLSCARNSPPSPSLCLGIRPELAASSISLSRSKSSPSQRLSLGFGTLITTAHTPPQFRSMEEDELSREFDGDDNEIELGMRLYN